MRDITSIFYYSDGTFTKDFYDTSKILHRDNDLPAVEYSDGYKEWRCNGELHRIGGPAFINGYGHWIFYENGVKTNLAGPAEGWMHEGKEITNYYIDGILLSPEQWKKHPKQIDNVLSKAIDEEINRIQNNERIDAI